MSTSPGGAQDRVNELESRNPSAPVSGADGTGIPGAVVSRTNSTREAADQLPA